ncbi:MAG: multicopper oxidase domain-containing protein, partial [Pseudomonadota bacterium]|nr:multicopper oxidase domain-containing protein [Pseudomonadota bacterium]
MPQRRPSRRHVLIGAAASAATAGLLPFGRPQVAHARGFAPLEARKGAVQLAPSEFPKTEVWGYDGLAPGPVLRHPQGGRLQRQLINHLPQPTSVHWHGIRIDNAMDGVPGLTQEAVPPGGQFDYDFALPDAGTYWYHAHWASPEQVGRGLHGALVVTEAEAPDVDRDEVLLLDDWRLNPEDGQIFADFDNMHDRSHAGRLGNISTCNGLYDAVIPVKQNERLRLRLINAANARIFTLALQGMSGWVMALDGMPLPEPVIASEALVLAPGQRIDLIVDITASEEALLLRQAANGEAWVQVAFPVRGQTASQPREA